MNNINVDVSKPTAHHTKPGFLDNVSPDMPTRARFCTLISNARAMGSLVAERLAEALFEKHAIGQANQEREGAAQILKADGYEGLPPVQATEMFCRIVHHAIDASGYPSTVKADLADNSWRAINQIWHARQIADLNRLPYEEFAWELVQFVHRKCRKKGRLEAVDLARYGHVVAERLAKSLAPR